MNGMDGWKGTAKRHDDGGGDESIECYCATLVQAHAGESADGQKRVRLRLAPDGKVESMSGTFVVDAEAGKRVEEAFARHGSALVIDYEHQSVGGDLASPDGTAPAAGWVEKIEYVKDEGIFGMVHWTERAARMIRADEYRYLSPVTVLRKSDRKLMRLDSVGLVNQPAIPGMERVAASRKAPFTKESHAMAEETPGAGEVTPDQKIGEIAAMLKSKGTELPEGAGRDAILDAVIAFLKGGSEEAPSEASDENTEVANAVRSTLKLDADAGKEQIVLALSRLADASGSQEEVVRLRTELDELKSRETDRNAHSLRERFVREHKINPHNEEVMANALSWAIKDPEAFEKHHAALDPLVMPGRTTPPAGGAKPASGDSEETLIANSLKEHDGNYKDAMVALQTKLIDQECERTGHARKRAVTVLEQQYPKIFGAAA